MSRRLAIDQARVSGPAHARPRVHPCTEREREREREREKARERERKREREREREMHSLRFRRRFRFHIRRDDAVAGAQRVNRARRCVGEREQFIEEGNRAPVIQATLSSACCQELFAYVQVFTSHAKFMPIFVLVLARARLS